MIAKFLGLPTSEQLKEFNEKVTEVMLSSDAAVQSSLKTREAMQELREDMKTLYNELDSNIRNVEMNVRQIKPILKVQDEEAVAFIKGIFSRHDNNMRNNQTALTNKLLQIDEMQRSADSAVKRATEASNRLNNVLNGLGMMPEYDSEGLIAVFRGLISEGKSHDMEHVEE